MAKSRRSSSKRSKATFRRKTKSDKRKTKSGKKMKKGKLSFIKATFPGGVRGVSPRSGKRKNRKSKSQKGGYKTCSLGYAMVKGMEVPAINNVEGELQFNDVYARLNTGNCNAANNNGGVNHPVVKTV